MRNIGQVKLSSNEFTPLDIITVKMVQEMIKTIFYERRKSIFEIKSFESWSFKLFFMFINARNVTSQLVYRLTKILRIQRVGSKQKIRKS